MTPVHPLCPDELMFKEFRGTRHIRPTKRWEVLSSPTGYLRGTWLPQADAIAMLHDGEFYDDGTVILIVHKNLNVVVQKKQLFLKGSDPLAEVTLEDLK